MFNTIFKKQFSLYVGILIISFGSMALVISQAFNSYFTNQKIDTLISQGAKLAELFEREYARGQLTGIINIGIIRNIHNYLDENLSFIYMDTDYSVVLSTTDIDGKIQGIKINAQDLAKVFDGEIVTLKGRLSNIFEEPVLTVGYPVMNNDVIVGAILLNSSLPDLKRTISEAYSITALCIVVTAILAFVLTYFSSRKITKPLMVINNAAKVIAGGDFDKRIDIKSNDEVGQLASSFNHMASSLDEQEKLRREFMANVSHDLRSPLTSMRGFLEAILDGTIPPEKQAYYIGVVLEESERLAKLANDILDIENITCREPVLNKTRFDLSHLIRKTVQQFEPRVKEKNLSMSISLANDKDYVYADYEKIQRVLYNLLDNAIKFTDTTGEIVVETAIKSDKVYVLVKDTGRGIGEDDQKRIFDRFYKADVSRGEDKKGTGLGLSIVKEFIKAHGETVVLTSRLGVGSEFTFSLPILEEGD